METVASEAFCAYESVARLGGERGRDVMRWTVIAISVVALAAAFVGPARAAKSKMGCQIGSEIWDASQGKCVPGKHAKKSTKKSKKDD
jgi:hypothetical protein